MLCITLVLSFLLSFTVDDLNRPAFWAKLAPSLTVTKIASDFAYPHDLRVNGLKENTEAQLYREGFIGTTFDTQQGTYAPSKNTLRALARAVVKMRALGIPPSFLLVYDQAWLLFSGDRLQKLLDPVLGSDWVLLPRFWVWHVSRGNTLSADRRGWPIHRDSPTTPNAVDPETGKPRSINIWMPLTPATPETSCMYLLPMSEDPGVFNRSLDYKINRYNKNDLRITFPLESVRAMPAVPGDILLWNHYTLHWGSKSSVLQPRISIAFEAQSKGFHMRYGDERLVGESGLSDAYVNKQFPSLARTPPSTLQQRLLLVARQMLIYQTRYPLSNYMWSFVNQTLLSHDDGGRGTDGSKEEL